MKVNIAIVLALFLISGIALAQIKYPVTSDVALTVGTVVTVDGIDANKIVAADGPNPTAEVIGIITAIQNVSATDYYLVKTEGYIELSAKTFTPGARLTSDSTGAIVEATNDEDMLVGIAVSATRVQILIDDDRAKYTYFDDTDAGLGADNVQDAIDSLADEIGDIFTDDITFEGIVSFDSTVTFGDDSVYFGGPVMFDSSVVFSGGLESDTIHIGQLIGTENDTIYFEQYLAGPEVVIDSIEAFGDGPIVIKDSTEFRDNVTFDSTSTATFGGPVTFDSTVTFGDDAVTFGGPVTFDGGLESDTIHIGQLIGTENDTIYFEQYLAGPEVVIDSIEAFGDGPIVIKDSTEFRDNVTFDSTSTATFGGPVTFDSTVTFGDDAVTFGGPVTFDGGLESDTIQTGWLIGTENDTIYFEQYLAGPEVVIDSIEALGDGPIVIKDSTEFREKVTFDSTVVFGADDTVTFGGPVIFDNTVVFNGELGQSLAQEHVDTIAQFGTAAVPVIAITFAPSGDSLQITAMVVISDEYTINPNYNGAKIAVELYDVTNTAVLKSYTVFLQDDDWYEIKEVTVTHIMAAPAAANDYQVRCYADGWGNGGRFIEGDLTIVAIQN